MNASHDFSSLERLLVTVLVAQAHERRHFALGELNFGAPEIGERHVSYFVVSHHNSLKFDVWLKEMNLNLESVFEPEVGGLV